MKISDSHFLEGAKLELIAGGDPMVVRRCLVIHHTEGASALSSINSMRDNGLSAHLVIDRDGTILQCRPFNRRCSHAGVSRWVDPHTGRRYEGLNSCSIGIELANAGKNPQVIRWAVKNADAKTVTLTHRNGGGPAIWEVYPEAQLAALFQVAQAIVTRYNLDDLIGHENCSGERKTDPGPALPMQELREFCGFDGLPVTYWK